MDLTVSESDMFLSTFVCYRRSDAFMMADQDCIEHDRISAKVRSALRSAGFKQVFFDTDPIHGILPTEHYESKAFKAIENCHLFIVLIGEKWISLLEDRMASNKRDNVGREIRAALDYEKDILPILIDGAVMPRPDQLPAQLTRLAYVTSISISQSDNETLIDEKIKTIVNALSRKAKIQNLWQKFYTLLSVIVYYFCAINVHIIGLHEFGFDTWSSMSKMWGGLFIWPLMFLPFVMLALRRPLATIVETIIAARTLKSLLVYASPLLLSTALACGGWFVEVMDPNQVPWTIALGPASNCTSPLSTPQSGLSNQFSLEPLIQYDRDNQLLDAYSKQADTPFWLINKCWPNVLFFLTIPVLEGYDSIKYAEERTQIAILFNRVLQDKFRLRMNIPTSETAIAYRISFAILVWLGMTGVIMSGFYAAVKIRDPLSDVVRRLPVDDAFMCLTYSLTTLMTWIPFRMNTEYLKFVYACSDLTLNKCTIDLTHYVPDIFLGLMLILGYVFSTAGLLAQYGRIALTLFGAVMIVLCIGGAMAIYHFRSDFARLSELWQFYLGFAIPSVIIVFVLWNIFSPSEVHFKDFRKELN